MRLKRLHLAGNRLSRLSKVATILVQLRTPSSVDLRGNPLTIGFYPPVGETQVITSEGSQVDTVYKEPFTLRKGDAEKDEKYASRLDMKTQMLRRAYEMLLLGGCQRLQILDGLSVDRSVLDLKDEIWEALVKVGIVSIATLGSEKQAEVEEDGPVEDKQKEENNLEKSVLSEQWPGEDSFA